jgi:hypothetical protein
LIPTDRILDRIGSKWIGSAMPTGTRAHADFKIIVCTRINLGDCGAPQSGSAREDTGPLFHHLIIREIPTGGADLDRSWIGFAEPTSTWTLDFKLFVCKT